MKILIKQEGNWTRVYLDESMKFEGGRVAAKQYAKELHEHTKTPVFNVKENGAIVPVKY